MNLGILIGAEADHNTVRQLARQVEDYGFHSVWCGDAPPKCEGTITSTLLAQATRHIPVGWAVTNPYLRHPAKTAVSIAKLNLISQGRFHFGIGAGSLEALRSLGLDWNQPVQHCREAIEIIRKVLAGAPVHFPGQFFTIHDYKMDYAPQTPPPIYVGCRRPRMLQMAGAIADGVILDNVPVEYLPFAKQQLQIGAATASKSLDDFILGNMTVFSVAKTAAEARHRARHLIPIDFITISPRELSSAGFTPEDIRPIQAALHEQSHDGLRRAAALVSDEMVDKFAVAGTPEDCIRRIKQYETHGVKTLILCIPSRHGYQPAEALALAAQEVLPAV